MKLYETMQLMQLYATILQQFHMQLYENMQLYANMKLYATMQLYETMQHATYAT